MCLQFMYMEDLESIFGLTELLRSTLRPESVDLVSERALNCTSVGTVLVFRAFHDDRPQPPPLELFIILVHRKGVPA